MPYLSSELAEYEQALREFQYMKREFFNTVPNLVMDKRDDLGVTQRDLALLVGVDHTTISKIESGSYKPSVELLKRIAETGRVADEWVT